jgi:hypothetical protein
MRDVCLIFADKWQVGSCWRAGRQTQFRGRRMWANRQDRPLGWCELASENNTAADASKLADTFLWQTDQRVDSTPMKVASYPADPTSWLVSDTGQPADPTLRLMQVRISLELWLTIRNKAVT